MKIGKFKSTKTVVVFTVAVAIATIGIVSFANTSAVSKKGVSPGGAAYDSPNADKPDTPSARRTDAAPSERLQLTDNISKVILRVGGMSCSGCIFTIKSSLEKFKGIRDVFVNLSAGEAEVYYDKTLLKDVLQIAEAITASGYPAKVSKILTADLIRKERDLATARSMHYIASAGEWQISREEFNTELNNAKNRYVQIYGKEIFSDDRGKNLADNLRAQIVSRLIDEGIQMQEVRRAGFSVDKAIVNAELDKFLNRKGVGLEKFRTEIEKNGYTFDYFLKKFEIGVLISKYIDDIVLDGTTDTFEKQRRYSSWFNNARLLAKVVYYDKEIERLIQTRSGGGCSGGSSSCSTSK